MIRYRECTRDDIDEMYALDRLCFEKPFRFERRTFVHFMAMPDIIGIAAVEDDDRIIGFILTEIEPSDWCCVCTIDVHPDYRRTGVGRTLMEQTLQKAEGMGLFKIYLHVYVENSSAQAFYKGLGFRRARFSAAFYGPGKHAWIMERTSKRKPDIS